MRVTFYRVKDFMQLSSVYHKTVKVSPAEDLGVLGVNLEKIELRQKQTRISADICLTQIVAYVKISWNSHLM